MFISSGHCVSKVGVRKNLFNAYNCVPLITNTSTEDSTKKKKKD